MSKLEKDFEKAAKKINAKLKEAAKALKEANQIADKAGYNGLILTNWNPERNAVDDAEDYDAAYEALEAKYNLIDVGALEEAMSEGGWSPSSSYC